MNENLHALLIGIDHYFPREIPRGNPWPSLQGSVRDIERIEEFLRGEVGLLPEKTVKLTASPGGGDRPAGSPASWPSYENLVAAFVHLAREAAPGDHVYIHYSGHGGRAQTIYADLKGDGSWDESLVPYDVGCEGGRYLRDVELAWLLQELVDRNLQVSLVLDCCHSGGATRGKGGAVPRGLDAVDRADRPTESLVASREELERFWRQKTAGDRHGGAVAASWLLPEPEGYVVLAACREAERAYEYPFENGERQGALTFRLLETLRCGGLQWTWRQLYDRLFAQIHFQFSEQTPMLLGDGARPFLGADLRQARHAVTVLAIQGNRVLLNTGQAQGVTVGSRFVIEPGRGAAERTSVEIRRLGATESWARILDPGGRASIQPGAQAMLSTARGMRLLSVIQTVPRENQAKLTDILERVREAIAEDPSGFLHLGSEGQPADYQVALDERGEYEIWDAAGAAVPNLRPALPAADPGALAELLRRLAHLTRYRNVGALANLDRRSELAGKLELTLCRLQPGFAPGDPPDLRPVAEPFLEAETGQWCALKIRNGSSRTLNLTILDLQPDWSIAQTFPGPKGGVSQPFDKGAEGLIRFRAELPPGYEEGTHVFKVFASLGTTSFRWLELPAFDRPAPPGGGINRPRGPLARLFDLLVGDLPGKERSQTLCVSDYPEDEWTSGQVKLRVRTKAEGGP